MNDYCLVHRSKELIVGQRVLIKEYGDAMPGDTHYLPGIIVAINDNPDGYNYEVQWNDVDGDFGVGEEPLVYQAEVLMVNPW